MTFETWWEEFGFELAFGTDDLGGLDKSDKLTLTKLAYNAGYDACREEYENTKSSY
jgi:hypothetical protein